MVLCDVAGILHDNSQLACSLLTKAHMSVCEKFR